jgi:hypothetical protein
MPYTLLVKGVIAGAPLSLNHEGTEVVITDDQGGVIGSATVFAVPWQMTTTTMKPGQEVTLGLSWGPYDAERFTGKTLKLKLAA